MATHPERLGKYQITGVLGTGAMGVVYRGHDPDIGRDVAIKTMRGDAGEADASGVTPAARFRNEARAVGRLQHPGIVAVYDFGRDGEVDYIAMEYVRGSTLSRWLHQAQQDQWEIDDNDVASIIGQLLDALQHAHAVGVWHRDIKPSNLIVTPQGKVKVTDFGIARIARADLTQATSLIGTPAYMAPERFLGKPIDQRVDIYAAGVVLYQMLTGQVPFPGAPEAIMYKAVHEPLVPPSQRTGQRRLAPYDRLVERALAKNPDDRFPSAALFLDALEATLGRLLPDAVSNATITALTAPAHLAAGTDVAAAPAPATSGSGLQSPATGGSSLPAHFSADDLAQAEARLGQHLGPMARVLVRRTARECADLASLYARLAEQVTDVAARQAFVQSLAASAVASPTGGGTGGSGASGTGGGRRGAKKRIST